MIKSSRVHLYTLFLHIVFMPFLCFASDDISSANTDARDSVSVSTGLTYLNFNQTFLTGANRNLQFQSFDYPYLNLALQLYSSENSFFKLNFLKYTPSSTDSNNQTSVEQKKLSIGSTGFDYHTHLFKNSKSFLKTIGLFAGLQLSALPTLKRTSATAVAAEIFSYNFFRLGLTNDIKISEQWSMQGLLSYTLPLSSNSIYKMSAANFIEADLSLNRHLNKNWTVDLGWNVRQQSYQLTSSETDPVTNQPFNANQDNLFSTIYVQTNYFWY